MFIVIAFAIFILWLYSEGYIDQAINFLVEHPWESIIILIALLFFLSWVWRKITEWGKEIQFTIEVEYFVIKVVKKIRTENTGIISAAIVHTIVSISCTE